MKKIEFVNGQAPYLNEQNLNQLQDNMEEVAVPEGGISGQVLRKSSNTDNDVEWSTIVEDSLTNDSSTKALSAKQGKILSSYSTSETVVGTWVDNKPIYRKTIVDTLTNDDVILTNVDAVIRFYGTVYISTAWRMVPYYETYNGERFYCNIKLNEANSVSIGIVDQDELVSRPCKIIIEYTKAS